MNNEASIADLLATTNAKAAAHAGLSDALEYGKVSALRVNGVMTITAVGDFGTFRLAVASQGVGTVSCNGYVVSSTCRDLVYAFLAARG
jgi:hypothetical protein